MHTTMQHLLAGQQESQRVLGGLLDDAQDELSDQIGDAFEDLKAQLPEPPP